MTEANERTDMWKVLREPFPPEQIGKLPRITCFDCRDAQSKLCNRHKKGRCPGCGNWITDAHIHLDYVGHAAVTDRLLKADPGWSWEPAYRNVDPAVLAAAAATGNTDIVDMVIANAPAMRDSQGGMWIKLTVGGVTRLGYGSDDDRGPDHDKKLASDAIRNAAMRFGVALDLWSKEGLEAAPEAAPSEPVTKAGRDWIAEAQACTEVKPLLELGRECNTAGAFDGAVKAAMLRRRAELTPDTASPNGFAGSAHS